MRVSVVVCTVNRARGLERLLGALRHQTHAEFEVVVVAGPSTDDTAAVLAAHDGDVRVVHNEEVHLSRSRNLGIEAAAGELVAFVDDDAIPDPGWLAMLAEVMRGEELSGVGGFVRDADGTRYQYRYSLCTRTGRGSQHATPPDERHLVPHADPFLYLQGTNACFRRDALVRIGGFDEEIEFFHDETDLCARLLDAGGRLRVVPGADVIHKYEASHVRDAEGRIRDPYAIVKNCVYVAHRNADDASSDAVQRDLADFADIWRAQAVALAEAGAISGEERERMLRRVDEGAEAGAVAARRTERRTRVFSPAPDAEFARFPVDAPASRRRVAFVSSEFPPGEFGGIGRFTRDLATGLAAHGWETHVVVPDALLPPLPVPVPAAPGHHPTVIDFEDGAWVHRVPPAVRAPRLADRATHGAIERAAAAFHAVAAIDARFGAVDVVSAPLWTGDGLMLSLDPQRAVATTLMTTLRTVVGLQPTWQGPEVELLLALEGETLRHSRHLHAISAAILDSVRHDYPAQTRAAGARVLPLGIRDRRAAFPSGAREPGARTRLLFVGRLERRKGVDLLLEVVAALLERRDDLELVLVGKDTPNTELGVTYREAFTARFGAVPGVRDRVVFVGPVDEDALYRHYADADVFVAPSRYESFGLVHVEAMMMGLPVVACRVGGLVEVVDEASGMLVPPGEAAALEQAIEDLLDDAGSRAAMGAAARERFERVFENGLAAARIGAAYADIAAAPHPGVSGPSARVLAASIERIGNVPSDVSREAAEALLLAGPADRVSALLAVWHAADDRFVTQLYWEVLDREPDREASTALHGQLRAGRARADVVREVGWSAEALACDADTAWLGDLLELPGWTEELACAAAFAQPTDERFAQDIVDLLVAAPGDRQAAREQVLAARVAGAPRPAAATSLLDGPFGLRSAPDFDGWAPMLVHLAALASPGAPLESDVRHATPAPGPVTERPSRRVKTARGPLMRVRKALDSASDAAERTGHIAEAVGRLEAQLRELAQRHEADRAELQRRLTETATQLRIVEEHGAIRAENDDNRLSDVVSALHASGYRTDILQRKLAALTIDLRDRLPMRPAPEELPEPAIVDEKRFRAALAEAGGTVRVNLGAGEKPLDGYVNVDMRPLEGIDVVADVRRLPFEPGSLGELMSAHLVEHFREGVLADALLPYWRSLLCPGGTLRVICPNWAAMTERLADGRMSWDDFKVLTFGLQDYEGDDHFAMYTPESLTTLLEAGGYQHVELVAADRMNGLCPEMELVARATVTADESREAARLAERT